MSAIAQDAFPIPMNSSESSDFPTLSHMSEALVPTLRVAFYSHTFGENFPHTFISIEELSGEQDGESETFGFSAKNLSPSILWGSVKGQIAEPSPRYIRQSRRQFSLPITVEQAADLRSLRAEWESSRYNLEKRNCVHFVAKIADSLGLQTNKDSDYFKRPERFLEEVYALNSGQLDETRDEVAEESD